MAAELLSDLSRATDSNSDPLSGATWTFYATGTTTPQPVYTTAALSVPHANPVVADAGGLFPAIFLDATLQYRGVLKTAAGATIRDIDPINNSLASQLAAASGSASVGFQQSGTGAVVETVEDVLLRTVWAESYGFTATTIAAFEAMSTPQKTALAAANATALWNAILSLRGDSTTLSTNGLGSGTFTAYSSGVLLIGEGIFPIAPDVLELTQDLGLIIQGRGSRRTNNAVRGRTNLMAYGSSSGYVIRAKANGARGLTLLDFDLTYYDANFTGDMIDIYSAPGVVQERMYVGTNGISAPTRLRTARCCLRSTYDEFLSVKDTVFNGAVDGWWSDDLREPSAAFSGFGGSQSLFQNVVCYDVTRDGFRHLGNRTRLGLVMVACAMNPISVSCERGFNFTNIDGISMSGCTGQGSTTEDATTEWLRAVNCSGNLLGCVLGNGPKAGTIGGPIKVEASVISADDGITVVGGPVTGRSNEFANCASAWKFAPASLATGFDVGPDLFKATVSYSYDIPADDALLAGHVRYDRGSDLSINGFRNTSLRVNIENIDKKLFTAANSTLSIKDTGRTILCTGTAYTLPTAVSGVTLTVLKYGTSALAIAGPSAGSLIVGEGAAKASMSATNAADYGGLLEFRGITGAGWLLTRKVGAWTAA